MALVVTVLSNVLLVAVLVVVVVVVGVVVLLIVVTILLSLLLLSLLHVILYPPQTTSPFLLVLSRLLTLLSLHLILPGTVQVMLPLPCLMLHKGQVQIPGIEIDEVVQPHQLLL